MTIRRSLAAGLAGAMLLTACAGTDDTTDTPGAEQPADDGGTDDAPDDAPDDDSDDDTDEDAAAGGSQLAAVVLRLDGERVPVEACSGVDGAVLATTDDGTTISLVREEGTALRYQAEGVTAETDQVEVEEVGASTIHRATIESDDLPAVDVELELGDTSILGEC